jgi:hypothetical protein
LWDATPVGVLLPRCVAALNDQSRINWVALAVASNFHHLPYLVWIPEDRPGM